MLKVIYEPKGRAAEYCPWAVNLYRGCGHLCKYCYAPKALRMAEADFHSPAPRVDIVDKLIKDCSELRTKGEFHKVLLCFSCDPYQQINDQFQLTKRAIEILHFYGQSVVILTKGGYRAHADLPLLQTHDEFAVTLTCDNDTQSREWEPGAALPQERIDTLKEANARGIFTWVSLEPVLYPEQSLNLIRLTHQFTNKYKLGIANYIKSNVDWADYGHKAIALLRELKKDFYIKEDLRKYLNIVK